MIYIQSTDDGTLPHHFDAACALYGAKDVGRDFRLTTFEEVVSGKFDALIRKRLFVGSTEFMREVFKRIGLENVRLPKNSNRTPIELTLEEAYQIAETGTKIFIKPVQIKLFTGFVLDKAKYACLKNLPSDTPLIAYEPFKSSIESEWRVYISNGVMIDSRNYAGDWTLSPNYTYVKKIIEENLTTFPNTYVIDVAVLKSGETVVVEFNDMWAIGNYGLPNDLYLFALQNRYFDIVRPK